jgi:NADPH-dependent glutamate synthase beta subunit-like oxidoreductase
VAAAAFLSALGLICALALAFAARVFYVKEDPRLEAIKSALPGINCGGCGYAGCQAAAKAILEGKAPVTICIGGGPQVADALARVMGGVAAYQEMRSAVVGCYGVNRLESLFTYSGLPDCRAALLLQGGPGNCCQGCLGYGTCKSVCPFYAIRLREDRLPEIDPSKCRGCGRCVRVCPTGVISLTAMTERLLHLNRTNECLAPCRQKCPAQVNVPIFIRHLRERDLRSALLEIKERNPFPLSVSRTCPHPCENICRRNIADQGIAVNHLARFVGEWERSSGKRVLLPRMPDTGHQVAVIGGGPAGLACAYFLRRAGHRPTIFEAQAQLGGMLRFGIPEYRLPNRIVDWEIEGILELGVAARTKLRLGRDFTLEELEEKGFEAVFLAMGAWHVPPLCVPGETAIGVFRSLDFLSKVGTVHRALPRKSVIVVGESNTAMDCARSCIRLGAESVIVICPCPREEMSARKRDVDRALDEGIEIEYETVPVRILSDSRGHVAGLQCCRAKKNGERSSQEWPATIVNGSHKIVSANLIVAAYERVPDLSCLLEGENQNYLFRTTRKATLETDAFSQMAAAPNIFAAGDLATGRATVVGAVAGGRLAARSIHQLLTNGAVSLPVDMQRKVNPKSILKNIRLPKTISKITIPELPVSMRCQSFVEEVISTLSSEQALLESSRCLQCGTHCYDGQKPVAREQGTSADGSDRTAKTRLHQDRRSESDFRLQLSN